MSLEKLYDEIEGLQLEEIYSIKLFVDGLYQHRAVRDKEKKPVVV